MDFEQQLQSVAAEYRNQGYAVTVRPGPAQLPDFAKDFKVELVGHRAGSGVLVAVKRNRDEVAADRDMQRYAEVTASQPGWRFDFAIVEPENPNARDIRGAREFSNEDIERVLNQADQLSRTGFARVALVTAWSALEAAMRVRLRASGQDAGWGSMPRQMVRELYSAGLLTPDEFHQLEQTAQLRNQIVHGFSPDSSESHDADSAAVRFLGDIARRLLEESRPERRSA
jgi:uncharacterized protein YutE (UPF0331/DUF86 family)